MRTYSSGLPALNLFAAGYMFFTCPWPCAPCLALRSRSLRYWSDKFVLLRGSKRLRQRTAPCPEQHKSPSRPPFHDAALTKEVATILLYDRLLDQSVQCEEGLRVQMYNVRAMPTIPEAVPVHLVFACMMLGAWSSLNGCHWTTSVLSGTDSHAHFPLTPSATPTRFLQQPIPSASSACM